jgi:hypothetical protein
MGLRVVRASSRVPLGLTVLQVAFWWLVLPWLDSCGVLESTKVGVLMFAVGIGIKIAVLAVLFVDLRGAYAAVGGRAVTACRAALAWGLPLLAVVLLLAAARDSVAPLLDTPTSHVTSHRFLGYDDPFWIEQVTGDRARHDAWIWAWDSGRILGIEIGFVLVLAALNAALARWFGSRPGLAVVEGVVATVALCVAWTVAFRLVVMTYDVFHDGILCSPLLFDLAVPFAVQRPETAIAAPAYLAIALGNRWLECAARSAQGQGTAAGP